ncbi:Thioesterase/thiol ester dehydrase-isomerase [Hypoxylon cercidicola]|nr:Thioesterase/thiol ester dehydrase-isomerase [Hypoxylon cercidicola]
MSAARVRANVLAEVLRCRRLTANPRINARLALGSSRQPLPRRFVSTAPIPDPSLPPHRSFFRRAVSFITIGIVFTSLGIVMGSIPAMPAVNGLLNPPTDEETLAMFVPETDHEREVEDFINSHPFTLEMRNKEGFTESRPHLKIPPPFRDYNLTGGTLLGPNRIVVPPVMFAESGGKSLVSISHLGHELCGHPGIIHGGLLATILDENLARCCFAALPHKVGMTANLNINYRAPAPAGSYIVLKATTTKVEGRKAWVEGRIETLVGEGEKPLVLAEATALFVSPKQAAMMMNVYPTT